MNIRLLDQENRRLQRRLQTKQERRTRSQYQGSVTGYDADRGVALVQPAGGGSLQVNSITTSANQRVSVSTPLNSTQGSSDAKPVIS
ncbi:MAG: hypothetical protein AAFN18_21145 [Cyanobacteria bacterium J06554_6]